MPQDNIERAIKRGAGETDGTDYLEIRYEGYGPGGTAVMVDCLTDNRNRTVAEVRHAFTKFGGNLGADGSVNYLFNKVGQLMFSSGSSEDTVMEAAIDAGAEDVTLEGEEYAITAEVADFQTVQEGVRAAGIEIASAQLSMIAKNEVDVGGKDGERLLRLMEALDDHDDVQQVYSNGNLDEDVLAGAL